MSKQETRAALRAQRQKLTRPQQRRASDALARHLCHQLFFVRARTVAFYIPNDGEIDPGLLLERAVATGKTAYLPVLDPRQKQQLCFLPWLPGDPLVKNCYGIPEPVFNPRLKARLWMLDVVCLPLVGFDLRGNRLGMGGGFYDRTFAQRSGSPRSRPLLVGMAHHFQQVDGIAADPWDIPLHAVATDQRIIYPHAPLAEEASV